MNYDIKILSRLNVLVACEESQRVAISFREFGLNAYSCDIVGCSGGHPEFHIMGDARLLVDGDCGFCTVDGHRHSVLGKWDLIIAHPPCTYLCNSGLRWLKDNPNRQEKQSRAIDFFMSFVTARCDHIAIENPVGVMSTLYRKPDQIYNPYDFEGETDCKRTCLWLKGLPLLKPTQNLPFNLRTQSVWTGSFDGVQYSWNNPSLAILRSRTPWGVARAMAEQWSFFLKSNRGAI